MRALSLVVVLLTVAPFVHVRADSHGDCSRGGSSFLVPGDKEICTDDSLNGPDALIF